MSAAFRAESSVKRRSRASLPVNLERFKFDRARTTKPRSNATQALRPLRGGLRHTPQLGQFMFD
jgi:hypothetical protein